MMKDEFELSYNVNAYTLQRLQLEAETHVATLKLEYEAGDEFALMQAVAECAKYRLLMPKWVAKAYFEAFRKVYEFRARTWDEVFGSPIPKGTNLKATRRQIELSGAVYDYAEALHRNQPIDEALFEKVGNYFSIGIGTAKKHYYHFKRIENSRKLENS